MKALGIAFTAMMATLLVALSAADSEVAGQDDVGQLSSEELDRLKQVLNDGLEPHTTVSSGLLGSPHPDSVVHEEDLDYWDAHEPSDQSDEATVEIPVDYRKHKSRTTPKHKKMTSLLSMLGSERNSDVDDSDDTEVHAPSHCQWYCAGEVCTWVCSKHVKGIGVEEIMRIAITKYANGSDVVDAADKDGDGQLSINEVADFVTQAFVPGQYDLDRDGFLAAHEIEAAGRK